MKPSPDTISKLIQQAVEKATTNGLLRPTALYLGDEEHESLKVHAEQYLRFSDNPISLKEVRRVDGLKVYRVLENSHLGVA